MGMFAVREPGARQPASSGPVPRHQPGRGRDSIESARPPVPRRSPGRALDAETRAYMEPRFGHDFSRVRVHADGPAAESAQAMNALAYTSGQDLVFDRDRYQPHSAAGRLLLAHELAHVVQQRAGAAQRESANDSGEEARAAAAPLSAEREADRAALSVAAGQATRVTERVAAATVQRSVLGSLAGTLFGAGFGAMAGALFGPIGAVVGAIVGGIAGLIGGASASAPSRKLSAEERFQARRVYGPSLDYDRVRVAVSRVMTAPSHARTPYETVYLPPDTIPDPQDLGDPLIGGAYFKLLVHELCHVWQTQHGIGVTRKLFSAIRGKYTYGGSKGLRKAWAQGKHFLDFGLEQQGEICADYYERVRDGMGTSAYRPYIMELQQGGRRIAPGLVPNSEPGDFPAQPREQKTAG